MPSTIHDLICERFEFVKKYNTLFENIKEDKSTKILSEKLLTLKKNKIFKKLDYFKSFVENFKIPQKQFCTNFTYKYNKLLNLNYSENYWNILREDIETIAIGENEIELSFTKKINLLQGEVNLVKHLNECNGLTFNQRLNRIILGFCSIFNEGNCDLYSKCVVSNPSMNNREKFIEYHYDSFLKDETLNYYYFEGYYNFSISEILNSIKNCFCRYKNNKLYKLCKRLSVLFSTASIINISQRTIERVIEKWDTHIKSIKYNIGLSERNKTKRISRIENFRKQNEDFDSLLPLVFKRMEKINKKLNDEEKWSFITDKMFYDTKFNKPLRSCFSNKKKDINLYNELYNEYYKRKCSYLNIEYNELNNDQINRMEYFELKKQIQIDETIEDIDFENYWI